MTFVLVSIFWWLPLRSLAIILCFINSLWSLAITFCAFYFTNSFWGVLINNFISPFWWWFHSWSFLLLMSIWILVHIWESTILLHFVIVMNLDRISLILQMGLKGFLLKLVQKHRAKILIHTVALVLRIIVLAVILYFPSLWIRCSSHLFRRNLHSTLLPRFLLWSSSNCDWIIRWSHRISNYIGIVPDLVYSSLESYWL